jgi:hypothetical protein
MKYLFFIIAILPFSLGTVYAVDLPLCDMKDYECYKKTVDAACIKKNPSIPWTNPPYDTTWLLKPNCNIDGIQYAPLTKTGIEQMITCIEQDEQSNRMAIQDGMSLATIGNYSGFRALEVARTLYRKRMNSVFSCGIVTSRFAKLEALEMVAMRDGKPGTEIKNKIDREKKRYEEIKKQLACDSSTSPTGAIDRMAGTAMKEYCQYTYYLDYLSRNTTDDVTSSMMTDARTGDNPTPTRTPTTTDQLGKLIADRSVAIRAERDRANMVLPIAIRTYREMDRTYIIHVMLTLIYDDYILLRDQLDKYLVITGQTFEKAFNAQDARKN